MKTKSTRYKNKSDFIENFDRVLLVVVTILVVASCVISLISILASFRDTSTYDKSNLPNLTIGNVKYSQQKNIGFTCTGNYITKINDTFIGCVIK